MKIIALIFLLTISELTIAQVSFWKKIQTPVSVNLNSIFALDSNNIWIAADSGKILFTSDKGDNWQVQTTGNFSKVYDIYFLNENSGWAIEWKSDNEPFGTYILKTSDGGNNWESTFYRHTDVFLHTIYFVDSLNGFSGGSNTGIVYTQNGGEEWYPATILDTAGVGGYLPVYKFRFFTPQYGYAVGGNIDIMGVIWRTDDYGETWLPYGAGPDPIYDFVYFDSLNIYTLAGDFEKFYEIAIIRSSDGGITWSYEEIEIYSAVEGISFRTETEGWAATWYDSNLLRTTDSGNSWEYYPLADSIPTFDIVFIDSLTGFMISDSGRVLRYVPDDPTNITEYSEIFIDDFNLYQNYPNPFNSQTEISFYIKNESFITIKLFNLLGEEIKIVTEGIKSPGMHSINLDMNSTPAGVYFYQLIADNNYEHNSQTKKMVLLK